MPARPAPTPPTPHHPSAETINGRLQLKLRIPHCGAVEMGGLMLLCCCTCLTVGRSLCGGSWRVSDFGVYLERQAKWQKQNTRLQYNEITTR